MDEIILLRSLETLDKDFSGIVKRAISKNSSVAENALLVLIGCKAFTSRKTIVNNTVEGIRLNIQDLSNLKNKFIPNQENVEQVFLKKLGQELRHKSRAIQSKIKTLVNSTGNLL